MTLTELEALLAAATARPWRAKGYGFGVGFCHGFQDDVTEEQRDTGMHNADLITAAVNALPALLAVARAAQAWSRARDHYAQWAFSGRETGDESADDARHVELAAAVDDAADGLEAALAALEKK